MRHLLPDGRTGFRSMKMAIALTVLVAPFVVAAFLLARAENRMYDKKKAQGRPAPWI